MSYKIVIFYYDLFFFTYITYCSSIILIHNMFICHIHLIRFLFLFRDLNKNEKMFFFNTKSLICPQIFHWIAFYSRSPTQSHFLSCRLIIGFTVLKVNISRGEIYIPYLLKSKSHFEYQILNIILSEIFCMLSNIFT